MSEFLIGISLGTVICVVITASYIAYKKILCGCKHIWKDVETEVLGVSQHTSFHPVSIEVITKQKYAVHQKCIKCGEKGIELGSKLV
jgi:hypothetical protein